VSDRGPQFVSKFWEELHKSLGTKLLHSSTYHPQTSGQTERVNQILEDMLRACVLEFPQKWDECLPLAEFLYNNSYQESIKMAPVSTLKQGYPLLPYEDVVPTRLSLVAW
jgi:transposase InsO family protein